MTIHKRRGGGYRHHYIALAVLVAFVISALATNYYGLGP